MNIKPNRLKPIAVALLAIYGTQTFAQTVSTEAREADVNAPVKKLGVVVVSGNQPTSLPTQIPTTMEGVTRAQIEQTVNATDSEDALKYLMRCTCRPRSTRRR